MRRPTEATCPGRPRWPRQGNSTRTPAIGRPASARRRAIALAWPARRSQAPSSSMPTQAAARKRILEVDLLRGARRRLSRTRDRTMGTGPLSHVTRPNRPDYARIIDGSSRPRRLRVGPGSAPLRPPGSRRQAPRNIASILDSARELGIRDAQATRALLAATPCTLSVAGPPSAY